MAKSRVQPPSAARQSFFIFIVFVVPCNIHLQVLIVVKHVFCHNWNYVRERISTVLLIKFSSLKFCRLKNKKRFLYPEEKSDNFYTYMLFKLTSSYCAFTLMMT